MNKWIISALAGVACVVMCPPAMAQRRTTTTNTAPANAKPLNVIYKQDFNEDGVIDNFENGAWTDDPAGAFGSKGSLKVTEVAERYIKWTNEGTTIAFMYYPHGVKDAGFQGWGIKANKNLHAEINCAKQDVWQFAKIKADSLTGIGGGASSPGETFKNLIFYAAGTDKAVENPYLLIDNIVVYSGEPTNPPSAPGKLTVTVNKKNNAAGLNWDVSTDDVGVYKYDVFRSDTQEFEANAKTRLASISDNYYEDPTTAAGKTYYYKVVAKNVGGLEKASDVVKYVSEKDGPGAGAAAPAKSGF